MIETMIERAQNEEKQREKIAVMDFGGQYAHLIATKIRQLGVYSEIKDPQDPTENFKEYKGLIISGSPSLSAKDEGSDYNKEIFNLCVPIIGFCFGHQEIAKHYGGKVEHREEEFGVTPVHLAPHPLFEGLSPIEQVLMSHHDSVTTIPMGFKEIAYSLGPKGNRQNAGIANDALQRYGFQFHPEVDDTPNGNVMLSNFLSICGCKRTWSMDQYITEQLARIVEEVGKNQVFLLVSGGVDSTVTAYLLARALPPKQLNFLHVDNGLMRKDESVKVMTALEQTGVKNLRFCDASSYVLDKLRGVVEPEQKRKIIGDAFVEVFEEEAKKLGLERCLLGQGTIYPDTIESGVTKRAEVIKTHHNRSPTIMKMIREGRVVEPIKQLYKEEVRDLGRKLGVPEEIIGRHPFPGPGLGIRLLCSDGEVSSDERLREITADANKIVREYGLRALVLPVRSVGVQGDLRTYRHPGLLSGDVSWDEILLATKQLCEKVEEVNRGIYNLWDEIPREAKLLSATVTRERLDLLREADRVVMEGLRAQGKYNEIWQCPTVALPLEINGKGKEFIIVRPVYSARAMTARPAPFPADLIAELRATFKAIPEISGFAIDTTSKPPGTIEWE